MRLLLPIAALLGLTTALAPRQLTDTPPPDPEPDVTETITVTERSDKTVTSETTIFRTVFTTIIVTETTISTKVETKSDVDTATEVIYVTKTEAAKRSINEYAAVPAPTPAGDHVPSITDAAAAMVTGMSREAVELMIRAGVLEKRETIFTTVTVIVDGEVTAWETITSTVLSTTTAKEFSTSVLTSTTYVGAETTVTITSTLVIRTTTVVTGPAQTLPPGSPDPNDGAGDSGDADNSGNQDGQKEEGGGLSTGAKAGIGAGVGVVGLIAIGVLGKWLWTRHQANKPGILDEGTGAGMSEVPVGFGAGGVAGGRESRASGKPPVSPVSGSGYGYGSPSPEPVGYRGAVGPEAAAAAELGGEHYRRHGGGGGGAGVEMSGEDALPRFPSAAEADGRMVSPGPYGGHGQQGGNVYEMPDQHYR